MKITQIASSFFNSKSTNAVADKINQYAAGLQVGKRGDKYAIRELLVRDVFTNSFKKNTSFWDGVKAAFSKK